MIHSRVSWMCLPVDRSITVSAPQRIAQVILSTSSPIDEVTAELPMLQLIFTRKLRRSEEHTSELQSHHDLVCRLLLEKKKKTNKKASNTQHHNSILLNRLSSSLSQ